jgi:hypothetical protein
VEGRVVGETRPLEEVVLEEEESEGVIACEDGMLVSSSESAGVYRGVLDLGVEFSRARASEAAATDLSHLLLWTRSRWSRERKALKTESKNFMLKVLLFVDVDVGRGLLIRAQVNSIGCVGRLL